MDLSRLSIDTLERLAWDHLPDLARQLNRELPDTRPERVSFVRRELTELDAFRDQLETEIKNRT